MKIQIHSTATTVGAVLMSTLMTGIVVGTVMVSYLTLVRNQNATVQRSQAWNASMAAAEAGVEEALAQLTSVPLTTNIVRNANGWIKGANGYYSVPSRALLNGSYTVSFSDVAQPVIYSTGTITVPGLNATISRTVEVRTTNAPVFSVGMAALTNITMNGNNIMTDSYISTDTNYSTGGLYDPLKARKNGDIASVNGIVNVGNADIRGDLLTGPTGTNTLTSVGKNGSYSGIYANDFNADYEDVKPPQNLASYLPPTSSMTNQKITNAVGGATGVVTYAYAFRNSGVITLSTVNGTIYVAPNAQVSLYVSGNINADNIYIAPGAKLTLYMAGPSFQVNSSVVNNGTAAQFSYYGLPSNTSIAFKGNAAFTGTIYAPEAAMKLGGGGSDATDFSGACVVQSVTMNGHMNFHFDEALATLGPTVYKAAFWREL